jgi:hypothetical protein
MTNPLPFAANSWPKANDDVCEHFLFGQEFPEADPGSTASRGWASPDDVKAVGSEHSSRANTC